MNRYLLCNKQAEEAKAAKKAKSKEYTWYMRDWTWWTDDRLQRPTEQRALHNVKDLAYVLRYTGEILEFSDDMWTVYFADLRLRYEATNASNFDYAIANRTGFAISRVERLLMHIDNVVTARYHAGLPAIPPVPMRYIAQERGIKKLQEKKGIRRVA